MKKTKMFVVIAFVLLASSLGMGCAVGGAIQSRSYDEAGYDNYAPMPAEAPMMGMVAEEAAEDYIEYESDGETADRSMASNEFVVERLIIRTGYISLRADDTVAVKEAVNDLVSDLSQDGAFVVYSNQYGGDDESPYISMQIRVPATAFDNVLDEIATMAAEGTTPDRNESADDVTEEFVDNQSRLESLQAARDRLLTLMENAETTEDLLAAEQQLTDREEEIESLQGRINYLTEAARLSSVSIEIAPYILSQPVDTTWRPMETIRRAFDSLLNGLERFIDFLIFFIISVLPILLIIGLIIYGFIRLIIWLIRRTKGKKTDEELKVNLLQDTEE